MIPSGGSAIEYELEGSPLEQLGDQAYVTNSDEVWPYVPPVVRGDHIWAIVKDDLDIPYVVRGKIAQLEPDAG